MKIENVDRDIVEDGRDMCALLVLYTTRKITEWTPYKTRPAGDPG